MPEFGSDAGTAPSAPASFMESLDATFDGPNEPAETVVQEGTPEPEPEPVAAPESEAPQPPVQAQEVRPPEAEPLPEDEEIGQPKITENAKGEKTWHYPESRARILMQDRQFAQQLREAIPGITVQDAEVHFQDHVDMEQMKADMASGDPSSYDRFVTTFFGESAATNPYPLASFSVRAASLLRDNNPAAFGTFAAKTAEALRAMDEQAFESSVLAPAVASKYDGFYSAAWQKLGQEQEALGGYQQAQALKNAAQNGDKRAEYAIKQLMEAERELYRVQLSDHYLTGKYRQAPNSLGNQPDPLAGQRAEIQRGQQEINNFKQQQRQQQVEAWNQKVESTYSTELANRVAKTLENVKSHYDPQVLGMLKNSILAETKAELEKQTDWTTLYKTQINQARQQSNPEQALAAATSRYLTRADSILKANAKRLIPATTRTQVASNQSAHQAAAAANARRAPGTGDPVKRSIVGNPANAATKKDFLSELNALIPT